MKKKLLASLLTIAMSASVIAGCGNQAANQATDQGAETTTESAPSENAEKLEEAVETATSAADAGLTPEEQEAVDAGLIQLDGTLPIIKDPAAFEEKYGKISMLLVIQQIVW